MASENKQAFDEFVAGTPESLRNVSSFRHDYKGILRKNNQLPFFVEMVDNEERATTIPVPWEKEIDEDSNASQILGIKFIVNPSSISVNMSKIINRTQSMVGWIEEHWGDEIDTLTFTGSTAAFVNGRTNLREISEKRAQNSTDKAQARLDFYQSMGFNENSVVNEENSSYLSTSPGLTTRYRRKSISYEQMRDLIKIFSANGCLFNQDGFVKDRKSIRLSYDYSSYIGYFESLDVVEDAYAPFRYTYTITFKAEKTKYKMKASDLTQPLLPSNDVPSLAFDIPEAPLPEPVEEPKPKEQESKELPWIVWERVTGQKWDRAHELGYSDYTAKTNLALRNRLLEIEASGRPFNLAMLQKNYRVATSKPSRGPNQG